MLLDIFSSIIETIGSWSEQVGLGLTVIIGFGLVLLTIIISFICTQFSIEIKTLKAVNKLNKYLELNPFVTEENLVEFNKLMKKIPMPMRRQWQQYMVTRDKRPSEFFNDTNCIDNPFKASNYESHIVAVRASVIIISLLAFVFSMSYFVNGATDTQFSFTNIISSVLLASVSLIVGEIYLLFLKSRRNSTIYDVYSNFVMFQKYIDKAVTTLPDYVDYEILFTRKEIQAGIPVLQEYLQQRAMFEEQQIKKSKESQVVHEKYDFSSLGINGSLVMEKAMHVSEQFIGNKNNIRTYIIELESQKDLLEKNYDEKVKNTQRKLRDIQETLDRLKEKLDATTNIIVGNDLRKQRENEIQKQRQIEKEAQEDSKKFEEEVAKIDEQIEAKRKEIEEDRKRAETSLNSEFKSYADKIYEELKQIVDEQTQAKLDEMSNQVAEAQVALEEKDRVLVEKNVLYDERLAEIELYGQKLEEQDGIIREQESRLQELGGIDDENNKEIFAVKKQLASRELEIEKKQKQIENQKAYIEKLKAKKHITGDELFVDDEGRMYYIDANGNSIFVNQNQVASPEEYLESQYGENYIENYEEQQEPEVSEEQADVAEQAQQVYSGLDFGDDELGGSLADKLNEEYGVKEEEPKPVEPANEYHKPVYDFQWENSNIQNAEAQEPAEVVEEQEPVEVAEEPKQEEVVEAPVEEIVQEESKPVKDGKKKKKRRFSLFRSKDRKNEQTENPQVVEEPKQEEVVEASVEEIVQEESKEVVADLSDLDLQEPENKPAEQEKPQEEVQPQQPSEIEEIDKLIDEQNAELEKQNQELSKQLEDTQKVASEKPKAKKPAKKAGAKKPAKKQAKKVAKKPAKKAGPKKATKKPVKKAEAKKPAKKAEKKPAKKPAVKKSSPVKKVSAKTPLGELNLAQFNEQLKNMLKEIDNDGEGNKE